MVDEVWKIALLAAYFKGDCDDLSQAEYEGIAGEAEEIFKHIFGKGSMFGDFELFSNRGQQVEISEKVIVKGGRRFLQVTRKTQRPDGSSNTEISETPLEP